jgi:hypothetical protein
MTAAYKTPEFLRAVLDTLLPGESADPPVPAALPSGSAAGVDPATYAKAARPALEAILRAAGSTSAFAAASDADRIAMLRNVERELPGPFRTLLAPLLADYYESPAVIAAFGWRPDPPQPRGHTLPPADEATHRRLDRVRQRGKLWRD